MSKLDLPLLDPATAPEAVRPTLESLGKKYGFLPNLYRVFANAPAALESYLAVAEAFGRTSLSPTERNLVLLAASRENGCHYCVAVHSTVADMQKDPAENVEAIRSDRPIDDRRLEALRSLTQAVVRQRGHLEAGQVQAFLDAGYQRQQVLEVLVGVTLKTLSNYTNHLAEPPLDQAFTARQWSPKQIA